MHTLVSNYLHNSHAFCTKIVALSSNIEAEYKENWKWMPRPRVAWLWLLNINMYWEDFCLKMNRIKKKSGVFWNGGMPSWQKLGPILQNKSKLSKTVTTKSFSPDPILLKWNHSLEKSNQFLTQ